MKFYLYHVRINKGGYDDDGYYHGIGKPLYLVMSEDETVHEYIRAYDRNDAKSVVRYKFPNARFFN